MLSYEVSPPWAMMPTNLAKLFAPQGSDYERSRRRLLPRPPGPHLPGLESLDGAGRFREDVWQREGGGGGRTRVLADGGVFEKAGVNFSDVFGEMSEEFAKQVPGEGRDVHRRRRLAGAAPAQPDGADRPRQLPLPHQGRQAVVRRRRRPDAVLPLSARTWSTSTGPGRTSATGTPASSITRRLKKGCDEYFYLPHRDEARGVGGIFFDYLEGDLEHDVRLRPRRRRRVPRRLRADRRAAARTSRTPTAQQAVPGVPPRPLRRVQPGLRPRHGVRPEDRRADRVDPDVAAAPVVRWLYDYRPAPGSPRRNCTSL